MALRPMPFAIFSLCAAAPTAAAGDEPTVWTQPDFIPPTTVSALVALASTAEWKKCSEKEADGVRECASAPANSSEIIPPLLEDIGRAMHASVANVDQIAFMRLPPSSPGIPAHHDQYDDSSAHGARSTVLLHLTSPKGGRTRFFSNLAMAPAAGTLVAFRSTFANGTQIEAAEHQVEAVDADSAAPRLDIMLGMVGELPVFAEPPRKVGPVRHALRAMRRLLFAPKETVARVGATSCFLIAQCGFAMLETVAFDCIETQPSAVEVWPCVV